MTPSETSEPSPQPESEPTSGPAASPSRMHTILLGPNGLRAGWSILLFIAIFIAIAIPASFVLSHILAHFHHAMPRRQTGEVPPLPVALSEAVMLMAVFLATAIMAGIERRPMLAYGLSGTHRLRHFIIGLLSGFGFLSLLIGILVITHHLRLDRPTLATAALWKYAAAWGCMFLLVGFFEELLLRGYMLITLARGIRFWPAAILLAVLFGTLHKGNPGESPFGLATAAGAAIVFSLSLWRLGSLWWAIGFHTAWDWAQSYFYGTADSGLLSRGHLMTAHPVGSVWFSGGATGPEGSVWCGLILILVAVFIVLTQRKKPWQHQRNSSQ